MFFHAIELLTPNQFLRQQVPIRMNEGYQA